MENDKIERIRERLLMCPVCIDEYKDPRILPCHHSVCLPCLVDYVRLSTVSGRLFRCPQCRADVFVPRGGLQELPSNFYVTSIMDEIGSKQYSSVCDICEREWIKSQFRCVDCDIDVCRFCIHKHKLFDHDGSKELKLIKIESGSSPPSLTSAKSCPIHTEETLQLYCNTCSAPVCITCSCEGHKAHETEPLHRKLLASQKWLQEEFDSLTAELKDIKLVDFKVTELSNQMETAADQTVSQIKDRGHLLKGRIDVLVDSRVESVLQEKDRALTEYDEYLSSVNKFSNEMQKGVSFLEGLQDGDMTLEVLDCFEQYKTNLLSKKKNILNKTIKVKEPSFTRENDGDADEEQGMQFGALQFKDVSNKFLHDGRFEEKRKSSCFPLRNVWCQILYAILAVVIIAVLFSAFGNIGYGCLQSWDDVYEFVTAFGFSCYLYFESCVTHLKGRSGSEEALYN